jgi:hypothetical protein
MSPTNVHGTLMFFVHFLIGNAINHAYVSMFANDFFQVIHKYSEEQPASMSTRTRNDPKETILWEYPLLANDGYD